MEPGTADAGSCGGWVAGLPAQASFAREERTLAALVRYLLRQYVEEQRARET